MGEPFVLAFHSTYQSIKDSSLKKKKGSDERDAGQNTESAHHPAAQGNNHMSEILRAAPNQAVSASGAGVPSPTDPKGPLSATVSAIVFGVDGTKACSTSSSDSAPSDLSD